MFVILFYCKCTLIVHSLRESARFSSARQPIEPSSRILRNFCQYIARFRHAKNCFYYNKHVHACKLTGIVEERKDNIYINSQLELYLFFHVSLTIKAMQDVDG